MSRFTQIRSLSLAVLATLAPVLAQADPRSKPELLPLEKGQRILFLGDSITHQGHWVNALELLTMTTRPELGLRFFNAGVGGDKVTHGLARLEKEVVASKPDVVTVLFGMNDAGYVADDARLLQTFEKDLDELVQRLKKETSARVVLLGPTFYDDQSSDPKKKRPWYNETLLKFQAATERVAEAYKVLFLGLNDPMRRVTDELRKKDPKATLSPDAVHPETAGGYAIAGAIAKELWKDPAPVELMLTPTADGGPDHVLRIPRIVFPIPPEARAVADLTKLDERLNNFVLRAVGVGGGKLAVIVDGKKIGAWQASELATGVRVGNLPEAPWCSRAQELWGLAEQRRKFIGKEIRAKVAAIKAIKDEKQRLEAYSKIHAQLEKPWARVHALEEEMGRLCAPFDVRVVIQPER